MSSSSSTSTVLEALDALYKNPDGGAKNRANAFLQEFQSQNEAWETANALLLAQELPLEPRLFAAQTFRSKVIYDLASLPTEQWAGLRATLLNALQSYVGGARVVQTQLSLTLAALALQLPDGSDAEWGDRVVPAMIERFGKDPASVGTLLEFLTVLPEEVTSNARIPVDNEQYIVRLHTLLNAQAGEVLRILSMYIQAEGITPSLQISVLQCLRSWLRAGEIHTSNMIQTPLFAFAFDAIKDEELFDIAIDVLSEMINETQEVHENMPIIELIISRLLPLREDLARAMQSEEEDKVRGLCRLFVAAGETYRLLILKHKSEFLPIVQAIASCAAYPEVEIAQITFRFWWLLATVLAKAREADPEIKPFLEIFENLLSIVIKLLRWPDDVDTASSSSVADHRDFRHFVGDTLKDCCYVLGATECLGRSLQMVEALLAQSQQAAAAGAQGPKWQDIEAPLFSMRAMGSEADMRDNNVTPRIMDIVASLPDHPKVKYAGLLVISRYTEWVAGHPERIPTLLSYISSGLSGTQVDETGAAAAQAILYLCQDCAPHLVAYLPQLYEFFTGLNTSALPASDLIPVTEGIASVVAAMPTDGAAETALQFLQPHLASLQQFASAGPDQAKAAIDHASARMEQIQAFLSVLSSSSDFGKHLPASCSTTCNDAFRIVDSIVALYPNSPQLAERSCQLLRRGMALFDDLATPIIPSVLGRLAPAFVQSGIPSYAWIIGKCIDLWSDRADAALQSAMQSAFEQVSSKVIQMLETTPTQEMADTLDDYISASLQVSARNPVLLFPTPIFPHAFRAAVTALALLDQRVLGTSIDFLCEVLGHDSLSLPVNEGHAGVSVVPYGEPGSRRSDTQPTELNHAIADNIRKVVADQGQALTSVLISGLVGHFQPDILSTVMTAIRLLALAFPQETLGWAAHAVEPLPNTTVPSKDKHAFMTNFSNAIATSSPVRTALTGLYGASRKSRERALVDRDGGGGFDVDRPT
ncbi:Nuclear transport regulator [Ceraceosorus bombacis]|uniref:Nuclear transport regulator n=1 Tax=Ceraceosorus bombacis TaxID=401625 RepID=A0A0P1BDY7_9BASI|nr:Nuclear transport regulator [Ceraceosorus bombacis]